MNFSFFGTMPYLDDSIYIITEIQLKAIMPAYNLGKERL